MSKGLFLLGCIPARIFLAYIAYLFCNQNNKNNECKKKIFLKNLFSIFTLMIGLSFIIIYLKGWRKTGLETEGRPIWWNNIRPLHGFIFILFSLLNLMNFKYAWTFLALDVVIGLISFIYHYYLVI